MRTWRCVCERRVNGLCVELSAIRSGSTTLVLILTIVTEKTYATSWGLHSPVLVNGGFPVINGLVTSFDRIEMVNLAAFGLLSWLETICKATSTCWLFSA